VDQAPRALVTAGHGHRALVIACVAGITGCRGVQMNAHPLPGCVSASSTSIPTQTSRAQLKCAPEPPLPPVTAHEGVWAGFGRADITPGPGGGLAGWGPEARIAAGYRLRLYARALVLEDSRGERVALVVADLPLISPSLHRLVAESLLARSVPIGADRLILSATHTHAGPSHFFSEHAYNRDVSSIDGYDPVLVGFLATGITAAVSEAYASRRAARVAWGKTSVWGQTWNRSHDAFVRDSPPWVPPDTPPAHLDAAHIAVDPTWTMLRVDLVDTTKGAHTTHPAGAFSIFAMHGTGHPAGNDLFDADIQGIVERGLERHIDSLTDRLHGRPPRKPDYATRAVHLFANGAEGDVSPEWSKPSRCDLPILRQALGPGGPKTPPPHWEWRSAPAAKLAGCLSATRRDVSRIGDALTRRAGRLFDQLGDSLREDFNVAVAFRNFPLQADSASELCAPEVGTAALVGAEDGRTRLLGWRLLGIFPMGLGEGDPAIPESGCHGAKRYIKWSLVRWLVTHAYLGKNPFPETAQLAIIRLGSVLIAAVPAEVTTMAGEMIRSAIIDSAKAHNLRVKRIAVLGLANGYISYVPTAAEYKQQDYEGGSALFGPRTAEFLATRLGGLAGKLADAAPYSPGGVVTPFTAYPGPYREILVRSRHVAPDRAGRKFRGRWCRGDTLVVRWSDRRSPWVPPGSQVLVIDTPNDIGGRDTVAWDDRPDVEVRLVQMRGLFKRRQGKPVWEVRWSGAAASRQYRVILMPRENVSQTADSVTCK
jgi:neutral ceramidase